MVAVGEGMFGILVLTTHPGIWVMIALEVLTGTGIALFYPASAALLPRLVPQEQMREASAISRLAMNAAMMAGAALAGGCVAVFGAGWALAACGVGMLGTVPLLLSIKVAPLTAGDLGPRSRRRLSVPRRCSASCAKDGRSSVRTPGSGRPRSSSRWCWPPGAAGSRCSGLPWPRRIWAARPPGG